MIQGEADARAFRKAAGLRVIAWQETSAICDGNAVAARKRIGDVGIAERPLEYNNLNNCFTLFSTSCSRCGNAGTRLDAAERAQMRETG